MNIKEIYAKSIITKSNLPDSDYVINPYTGCSHSCIYCYASFMKRFTNHKEEWGKFVDIKINSKDLIPKNIKKFNNKSITIASVTDPYQPIERKYKITRSIIEKLIPFNSKIYILTKSDLIIRDIDLIKKLKNCKVAISLSLLDNNIKEKIEPFASNIENRIDILKKLKENGIYSVLFMSPIFPEITSFKEIINKTKKYVDEYWFENLNITKNNWNNIKSFLKEYDSSLIELYNEIYFLKNSVNSSYFNKLKKEINNYCKENKLNYKVYFHHSK